MKERLEVLSLATLLERGRGFKQLENKKCYYSIGTMSVPVLKPEYKSILEKKEKNQPSMSRQEKSNIETTQVREKQEAINSLNNIVEKKKEEVFLFDKIETYDKIHNLFIEGLKPIKKFLKDESKSESYLKQMEQYKKSLEKIKEKINLKKIDEEEYSEEVTKKYLDIVERDYIKILISVTRGRKIKNEKFYVKFEDLLENYLKSLHIEKLNAKIVEGKKMTNDDYNYGNIVGVSYTEKENLDKTIKEIENTPYKIKFYDEDEEVQEYIIKSRIHIMKKKEK